MITSPPHHVVTFCLAAPPSLGPILLSFGPRVSNLARFRFFFFPSCLSGIPRPFFFSSPAFFFLNPSRPGLIFSDFFLCCVRALT